MRTGRNADETDAGHLPHAKGSRASRKVNLTNTLLNASTAREVDPDLWFWIDEDFFALVEKYPQIQNDRFAYLGLVAAAQCYIMDFDVFSHDFVQSTPTRRE